MQKYVFGSILRNDISNKNNVYHILSGNKMKDRGCMPALIEELKRMLEQEIYSWFSSSFLITPWNPLNQLASMFDEMWLMGHRH